MSVSHEGKVARLVSELGVGPGRTLVFVRTKRGADRLVKRLSANRVQAVAMHGDKSQGQRERALANFEAGVVNTLVATDVAARGIDVAGITHVINYDIPATQEDYVHRIGRTARAGASGVGVTLVLTSRAASLRVWSRRSAFIASSSWAGCRAMRRADASARRRAVPPHRAPARAQRGRAAGGSGRNAGSSSRGAAAGASTVARHGAEAASAAAEGTDAC